MKQLVEFALAGGDVILVEVDAAAVAGLGGGNFGHHLAGFFGRRKPDWIDVRKHSLIVLMAEKALRRLIVGEAQPELPPPRPRAIAGSRCR